MWNFDGYFMICVVFGYLVPSIEAAGLFGTLLGDNDNNNRPSNPTIPLRSSLGLGTNNGEESYRPTNNEYTNSNRGLLPLLGVNMNNNRPNINNLNNNNRFPNTGQNTANNINDLKKQVSEAEKLLERLKEKNRLKEQKRLEDEKNNQGQVTNNKDPETADNKVEEEAKKEGTVLKSFSKKKFFTIVKPVVPENEAMNYNETVYFFDY